MLGQATFTLVYILALARSRRLSDCAEREWSPQENTHPSSFRNSRSESSFGSTRVLLRICAWRSVCSTAAEVVRIALGEQSQWDGVGPLRKLGRSAATPCRAGTDILILYLRRNLILPSSLLSRLAIYCCAHAGAGSIQLLARLRERRESSCAGKST